MDDNRKKIINRLKTIKGHISGIEKMIEDEKSCPEILVQITAVRSSIHNVGLHILENNMLSCVNVEDDAQKKEFEALVKLVLNYSK